LVVPFFCCNVSISDKGCAVFEVEDVEKVAIFAKQISLGVAADFVVALDGRLFLVNSKHNFHLLILIAISVSAAHDFTMDPNGTKLG